jgi:hypothetical protein
MTPEFKSTTLRINKILFSFIVFLLMVVSGCKKEDNQNSDNEQTIFLTNGDVVNNSVTIHDPNLNMVTYENFLKYISGSDRFLIVTQKDFEKTFSKDKVVLSIRHDMDRNIDGAIRMAYREHKYGVKATYFVLHSAKYYGKTELNYFKRNDQVIYYLRKLQDSFGHEIGFHNDLITLQVVYNIEPKAFLAEQLKWLRENGINIIGTCAHGSPWCYVYHYLNYYFWKNYAIDKGFLSYEFIVNPLGTSHMKNMALTNSLNKEGIKIIKDDIENYNLDYNSDIFRPDYNFSDCTMYPGGKRWHMGMEDFDKIPLGSKVVILLHAEHWD